MSASVAVQVRESRADEEALLAEHFYRMWRDNEVAAEHIHEDWMARVLKFIAAARRDLAYRAFVVEGADGVVVGSAGCQLFAGLYPDILQPAQRRYGYLWGVYVEPEHRRQGIARRLTQATTDYLASIGCTHAVLHASPPGRPVYAALGFEATNEMRLKLGE
jgi:ribosomal protein S18 acetylase RimI-like enzyme